MLEQQEALCNQINIFITYLLNNSHYTLNNIEELLDKEVQACIEAHK